MLKYEYLQFHGKQQFPILSKFGLTENILNFLYELWQKLVSRNTKTVFLYLRRPLPVSALILSLLRLDWVLLMLMLLPLLMSLLLGLNLPRSGGSSPVGSTSSEYTLASICWTLTCWTTPSSSALSLVLSLSLQVPHLPGARLHLLAPQLRQNLQTSFACRHRNPDFTENYNNFLCPSLQRTYPAR